MTLRIFNFHQPASVTVISQSSQSKSTSQTDQNISYLAGIFITFVIVGFILGCLLQYRKYKKQRHQRTVEIIQEIEILDKIQRATPDLEQKMILQRKEQIEALEKIWNKTP